MSEFIPYTKYFKSSGTELNKIIKKDIQEMFSNIKGRLLSASVFNPDGLKNFTLFIDSHDSKIKYYNAEVARCTLYVRCGEFSAYMQLFSC